MNTRGNKKLSNQEGFTLLEFIVILAGLGILSSLAIPNYIKYLDYAKVDEAKALLNSTAADCLQGLRRNSSRLLEPVNSNIISFSRLKSTGYIFKNNESRLTGATEEEKEYLPNCGNVLITAAQLPDRKERLPDLGFNINTLGTLTKIAVNTGKETKSAAESWAGANTTDEKTLIDWLKLNEDIAKAKEKCQANLDSFVTGRTNMWDPEKTKSCTDKPPISDTPETCTPGGCTKEVWYVDGEFCGYEQSDFRDCLAAKTTAACQAEKDNKASEQPPWTTETISGDLLPNCKEPVWFFEGEDVGSSKSWQDLMCTKNIENKQNTNWTDEQAPSPIENCILEDGSSQQFYFCNGTDLKDKSLHEQCLRNKKIAECEDDIDEKRVSGKDGSYINTTQGPPPCGKTVWFCNKNQYTELEYQDTSCGANNNSCSSFTGSDRAECSIPANANKPVCVALRSCTP